MKTEALNEGDTSMSIEENKEVIRRYVEEVCTAGNLDVLDEIIDPNMGKRGGIGPQPDGPEIRKQMVQSLRKDFPDLSRTTIDMVAEGDKVVLYATMAGTHTEEGSNGLAPTGEGWEMTSVVSFLIEDGKMVGEPWACGNPADFHHPLVKAAMRQFIEKVWNEGDLEAADQYIASNYVRHDPAAPQDVQGIDGFKQVIAMYRTALPDLHLKIEEIIAGGVKGEIIAIRWSGSGTHQGELMGVAPTGKQVNSSGNTFLRLEQGKIVEEWVQWDNLGLLQQIGAMPAKG
jgi:steroid delta-isomerase-like uncharacterized protein